MPFHRGIIAPLIVGLIVVFNGRTAGSVLRSLDRELDALVTGTEPYLVTVRGEGGWRNLVASGIVFDSSGHVITTSHVFDAANFEITFRDGRTFPAQKVGIDNFTGLAVLKIQDHKFSIPAWKPAESPQKGDWVALVGNSYEEPGIVFFGSMAGHTEDGFLRLAVGANPGSSGGAVLNIDGDIIGILVARVGNGGSGSGALSQTAFPNSNALKFLRFLGSEGGQCYAVPFEIATHVVNQIIEHGRVRRGYLGIVAGGVSVSRPDSQMLERGALVIDVESGSPADSAGIQKGDIIRTIDSEKVSGRQSLYTSVRGRQPGDRARIIVSRAGETLELTAVLAEAPEEALMGGREGLYPSTFKASKKLPQIGAEKLESEIMRLRSQIARLQGQLDDLKKRLDQ